MLGWKRAKWLYYYIYRNSQLTLFYMKIHGNMYDFYIQHDNDSLAC